MFSVKGKAVFGGAAAGHIYVIDRSRTSVSGKTADDAEKEKARFEKAICAAQEKLDFLYKKTVSENGGEAAEIFDIQRMMLSDDDFLDSIRENLAYGAEFAVFEAEKEFSAMFENTDDEYMRARSADVKDISDLLLDCLAETVEEEEIPSPFILVSDEILPRDIVRFDKKDLLAVVSVRGSVNSHASILARSMGIPAIIGAELDFSAVASGMTAIVDGDCGEVIFEPDEQTLSDAVKKTDPSSLTDEDENGALPLDLCVNISSPDDVTSEMLKKTAGIGLFRTEFLYMGRFDLPDEEEQFAAYTKVLRAAEGKKVTIRTFDLGSDKKTDALPSEKEENPALGRRGLRLYSAYPDVFRTQIRSLLRAAVYGDLQIMYPMVTSCGEFEKIRETVKRIAAGLSSEKIPFRIPPQGVMIETPAAAMISDKLAETADFFSIGTNDLTQYTLALDRQSSSLDSFFDPYHEAVLRLIRITVENAHDRNIPVCICGELAADTSLSRWFADLHTDGLSVPYPTLSSVKKALNNIT